MDSAGSSGFFTNPGPAFALVFCAILIVLSYVIITINFVVVMVESYIIVSVAFVFLGFGGSRWTAPYVERYIGLAVSIGIKIVLIYCLISAGFNLGVGWAAEAATVGTSAHPALTAFDAMGQVSASQRRSASKYRTEQFRNLPTEHHENDSPTHCVERGQRRMR